MSLEVAAMDVCTTSDQEGSGEASFSGEFTSMPLELVERILLCLRWEDLLTLATVSHDFS